MISLTGLLLLDAIQDYPQQILISKFNGCFFRPFEIGLPCSHNEDNAIAQIGMHTSVVNRQRCGRV